MKKILLCVMLLVAVAFGITSCDSIDCSLENQVLCQMGFYDATGAPVALTDTLTITAAGTDSVLYNRGIKTSKVGLPLSYYKDGDTLTLTLYGEHYLLQDDVVIKKTNYEHFESLDCPVKMMHVINGVESTNHFIDSVVVVSPKVEYNNGENIKIYLHTAD
ncbi:MAG: hypothetical protein KBT39_11645 [Bacteroidales bacterium]|nr:hypothetical protein [Bacteroidales bacterium]